MAGGSLLIGTALCAACLPTMALAQTSPRPARPTVTAVRVDVPPAIDGRLDDPAWRGAARVTQFVQQQPNEGAPATEDTEVLVAYDAGNLYFGIRARYGDRGLMRANRSDRDQTSNDDTVAVFFDPFLDQQRGYSFAVNPYGVQADAILPPSGAGGGQSSSGDASWNVLYRSAGQRTEDGWTAEMAIPIKSLRYPSRAPGETHRWGFQIVRVIKGKNETVTWSPISTNVAGFLTQMGILEGMRDFSTRPTLELLPTVTAIQAGRLQPSGAFTHDAVNEAGLNVKFGLSSNLTLDATYNPDFSQIESDRQQIEINQRFPLFFPELRPFFLEGKEIFSVPSAVTFFHTRTIVDPRYGAKLTGKIGRVTIGTLLADDEAPGRVDDPRDPLSGRTATIVAGRLRYALYGDSYVGALVTDRQFAGSFSRLAAVDGQLGLGPAHQIGFKEVLTDHLDLAGQRDTGTMLDVYVRRDARHVSWLVAQHLIDPDFRVDTGFVQRTDERRTLGDVVYRWWPQSWVTSWGPRYDHDRIYNYAGVLTDELNGVRLDGLLATNVTVSAGVNRKLERYGDVDFRKTQFTASATVNTSRRVLIKASLTRGDEIRFIAAPYLGHATVASATVTLRPLSRLQSEIGLDTTRFTDVRTGLVDFDVKIYRALTTYQFTERLLLRNILEGNTLNRTLGVNLLGTYRVNAGTVFFLGYDDRYRDGDRIDQVLFPEAAYQRTNRAVFAKLQYLFRR